MKHYIWNFVSQFCTDYVPQQLKANNVLTKWQPGTVSPLSTHVSVGGAMLLYLAIIFGGRMVMTDQKPLGELYFYVYTRAM